MSDKLQFYKFYPSDWMMGRIQKCSGDCVKAFINFTCLYWNKECQVLIEDAKIELEEHYETLVKYKIIVEDSEWIKIKYLEEQNNAISEKTQSKSLDGRKGNLKRWHPDLYAKVCDGKISLKQAEQIAKQLGSDNQAIAEVSHSDRIAIKKDEKVSHSDRHPIATRSQNIADKDKDKDKDKENIVESSGNIQRVKTKTKTENVSIETAPKGNFQDPKRVGQTWNSFETTIPNEKFFLDLAQKNHEKMKITHDEISSFMNFYASGMDKNGTPIRNWSQCLVGWINRERQFNLSRTRPKTKIDSEIYVNAIDEIGKQADEIIERFKNAR